MGNGQQRHERRGSPLRIVRGHEGRGVGYIRRRAFKPRTPASARAAILIWALILSQDAWVFIPKDWSIQFREGDPTSAMPVQWLVALALRQLMAAALVVIAIRRPMWPHMRAPLWVVFGWFCLQALNELVGGNFFGLGQIIELLALTVAMATITIITALRNGGKEQ